MANPTITLVKKIMADGEPCRKCLEVEQRLIGEGLMNRIDHVIIADERDSNSEGMKKANQYKVDRAPFFIIEEGNTEPRIYTVYLQFVKEVLNKKTDEAAEAKEILENNNDLDFI